VPEFEALLSQARKHRLAFRPLAELTTLAITLRGAEAVAAALSVSVDEARLLAAGRAPGPRERA
jgi:hypothetical protein